MRSVEDRLGQTFSGKGGQENVAAKQRARCNDGGGRRLPPVPFLPETYSPICARGDNIQQSQAKGLSSRLLTRGASVAPSVKRPISAQVVISRFEGLSSTSGSLLSTRSLLGLLGPPLSLHLPHSYCLSPSLSLSLSKKPPNQKDNY